MDYSTSLMSCVKATVRKVAKAPPMEVLTRVSNADLVKGLLEIDVHPRVAVSAVAQLPPRMAVLTRKQVMSTIKFLHEYDLFPMIFLEEPSFV